MATLDKLIHERARLLILTYLASHDQRKASFTELKEALALTAGNLSIQMKKLSKAEYLSIHKTFRDNKPYTSLTITPQGSDALNTYVEEMESIINQLKK